MKYFSSRLFIRYQITVRQTNKLEYLQNCLYILWAHFQANKERKARHAYQSTVTSKFHKYNL